MSTLWVDIRRHFYQYHFINTVQAKTSRIKMLMSPSRSQLIRDSGSILHYFATIEKQFIPAIHYIYIRYVYDKPWCIRNEIVRELIQHNGLCDQVFYLLMQNSDSDITTTERHAGADNMKNAVETCAVSIEYFSFCMAT